MPGSTNEPEGFLICASLLVTLQCNNLEKTVSEVESRAQGSRPRLRTALPRTDTLETKDRNARGQGQGPRTQT